MVWHGNADSLGSSGDFTTYASVALAAASFVGTSGYARGVRCEGAGVLQVHKAKDNSVDPLPFKDGELQPVVISGITEAGSTVTGAVTLYR